MSITTNHVFVAFSEQIDRSHSWMAARFDDACGYPKTVLVDRIAQRLVETGLPAFAKTIDRRIKSGLAPWPEREARLDFGDATIVAGSGAVAVSVGRVLRAERDFCAHWIYALSAIVTGSWSRRSTTSASLVYDLTDADVMSDGSDVKFVAFCRTGPVMPLREGQRRLIEADQARTSSAPDDFEYCRYPLVELAKQARLGSAARFGMLLRHLALFLSYHLAIARMPALVLVAREFAYTAVAAALDARGVLSAVVLTCSSYRHQPLWARARKAPVHMVWYAQNWKPTQKIAGDIESDYPTTRWIRADVHWVWTAAFAAYLRSLIPGDFRAVGPILWRLPEAASPNPARVSITVFDVPAVSDEIMRDLNGEITNYLSPANLKTFIGDIVRLKSALQDELGKRVTLSLKMKRGFQPDYARGYFDYVDDLVRDGAITVAPAGQSVFQAIAQSHLAIVYPYTSPAYVAERAGVPAVYYDATGTIRRHTFADDQAAIAFAGNPEELHRIALSHLMLETSR
jgi:hypothetical protein